MSGYVRIHRSLLGHAAFRNESETMAFAWLVAKAAWKPRKVRYKGRPISLKRGQVAISQRDMAAAFDRDKAWIERLWKRLKSEAMIEAATEAGVAVITICNYNQYQAEPESGEAVHEAVDEAANEADVRQRRGTEQEEKKYKKDSVPNGTGPRPTLAERIWSEGLAYLIANGQPEKSARSQLGKWRKAFGDDGLMDLISHCQATGVSEPLAYIEAAAKKRVDPENERREFLRRRYGGVEA